jgi:hypothetical protein
MLKTLKTFVLCVLLLSMFFTLQTSLSNLLWLDSIQMPVDLATIFSVIAADFLGMNSGIVPLYLLLSVALAPAFIIARLVLTRVKSDPNILYIFAGMVAITLMLFLMPLAFFNLEFIAGARSLGGKLSLILGGGLVSLLFSYRMRA